MIYLLTLKQVIQYKHINNYLQYRYTNIKYTICQMENLGGR